jgi:hypothetical protein
MKENRLVISFKKIINENNKETEWKVFGFIIDNFDKFVNLSQSTLVYFVNWFFLDFFGNSIILVMAISGLSI